MKTCPKCNANLNDEAVFCTSCGTQLQPIQQYAYVPAFDPTDHTSEFDQKDISDNKVVSMAVYLAGVFGIIIALLMANSSKYVAFHVRQALKITIVEILLGIITVLLFWTFIVPVVTSVMLFILTVIRIICFCQVCSGKAKEPAIISALAFLK